MRPSKTKQITIIDACSDPALFAKWFRNAETWRAWFAFLRALFALPMPSQKTAALEALAAEVFGELKFDAFLNGT